MATAPAAGVDRLLHAPRLRAPRPSPASPTTRNRDRAGSRRSARSTDLLAGRGQATETSGVLQVRAPVRVRSATPRRPGASRRGRADGPNEGQRELMAGSPIATLSASVAPSPWPTMAARRRIERAMRAHQQHVASVVDAVTGSTSSHAPSGRTAPRVNRTAGWRRPVTGERRGHARRPANLASIYCALGS